MDELEAIPDEDLAEEPEDLETLIEPAANRPMRG
jgi:hypothetical protein